MKKRSSWSPPQALATAVPVVTMPEPRVKPCAVLTVMLLSTVVGAYGDAPKRPFPPGNVLTSKPSRAVNSLRDSNRSMTPPMTALLRLATVLTNTRGLNETLLRSISVANLATIAFSPDKIKHIAASLETARLEQEKNKLTDELEAATTVDRGMDHSEQLRGISDHNKRTAFATVG